MKLADTIKRQFRYSRKDLKRDAKQLPLIVSAAAAGSVFTVMFALNEHREMRRTVDEQREQIAALLADRQDAGGVDGIPDAGAAVVPCEKPQADAETCDPVDARADLAFANMKACSYFVDAVELTAMRRNNCKTRKKINMVIGVANDHCRAAHDLTDIGSQKNLATENIARLEKLRNHQWVTWEPCSSLDDRKDAGLVH